MRYVALATDFDDTLARDGRVDSSTVDALRQAKASGRYAILVTGRELDELLRIFPAADIFDWIVAENGALLYKPDGRETRILGEAPVPALIDALRARSVSPLEVGRVMLSISASQAPKAIEAIREAGLEHQLIFNKESAMILPPGISKATGLRAAAAELGLSLHNVVGIGDAENDQAFLAICECAVAVANALPMVKQRVDWVTNAPRGVGVQQLIDRLRSDDLADINVVRHDVVIGSRTDGPVVHLSGAGSTVLVTGGSGSGKSTFTTGVLERLTEAGYQFCIVDPEGDYENLEGAIVIGDAQHAPTVEAVLDVLQKPEQQVVVNLLGIPLETRPAFFDALLPRLQEVRARTGRPHWIVIDEAHHLLPPTWRPVSLTMPEELAGLMLITVHPNHLAQLVLRRVEAVVAVGDRADDAIAQYAQAVGRSVPAEPREALDAGMTRVWWPNQREPFTLRIEPPRQERQRHARKYAEGDLGPDRSFYFRGPDGKLCLQAQNLHLFLQIGDGVDDATWQFHLERGDYTRWFRDTIKDDDLADEIDQAMARLSPSESRRKVRAAIQGRYTIAA
ncbi:MAG: HAD-IIB family hydrolase [Chloroflexi bacterium]|nr:HAD-IIB family hydrolase [Chloroflexota bacterium]